jgi:HSP20 family molecular chaperone IbpA
MNNEWLNDVIEFQKKMMEFSKNFNSSYPLQDLITNYMAGWGSDDSTREKRVNSEANGEDAANPPPQVYEEGSHEAILHIFLPGIKQKEDLTITIIDELLHITGKSKAAGEREGSFSHLFRLPVAVNSADIHASYESDYLIIRIPKLKNKFWQVVEVQFQ